MKADAKALEFRAAIDLSGDSVGIQEIIEGADIHEDNRKRFNLPTRLIAKTYIFRLLYGGSAYAYASDNEFSSVSKSEKFWQEVIDETYNKYKGLAKWHKGLMEQATLTGKIRIPTGREYTFYPEKDYKGNSKWPRTKILNYPVQGYAADLVMIARVSAWRRLEEERKSGKVVFFNSVHDDLELDCQNDEALLYRTCITLEDCFSDIPKNVEKIYNYKMKIPLAGEISFGSNLAEMVEFHKEKGIGQFFSQGR